jgi:hypothetical protein
VITDLSLTSLGVEGFDLLKTIASSIDFTAEVHTSHPGVGMGLKSEELSESDRPALDRLIAEFSASLLFPEVPGTRCELAPHALLSQSGRSPGLFR